MDNKTLCLQLIRAETEQEVVDILTKNGYWNDLSAWKFYGDMENNFSIIGNQQSSAETALVEKLVNSIDAVLISECLARGIHPESPEAPQNIKDAVQDFFHVYGGSLTNIDAGQRNLLADKIKLVATGYKSRPTYTIIDSGEGQYPEDFPATFLSLAKSNKIKIPFVQGKFNMGGSGVLQFCGTRNIQLIVSKKNTVLGDSKWGFTVVRRQEPAEGYKSSAYTYLAPDGEILSFESDSLPVAPSKYPDAYGESFESGTLIKLYEYAMSGGLKTNLKFDLFYKLNQLLPQVALPIRMYERRKGYKGQTMQSTLNGMNVRLIEDRGKNVEGGFPSSFSFGRFKGELYAFSNATNYVDHDGILFVVNGQTQGSLSSQFFNRKNVGMGSLSDSVLLIVNCDGLKPNEREDLFMNSRDRLRYGEIRAKIESELEQYVSQHEGLKELRRLRREEKIKQTETQAYKDVMEKIIGQSHVLSSLFKGSELKNPFKQLEKSPSIDFTGKQFPTHFDLMLDETKQAHLGQRFRIQYVTDANNDYLTRENEAGQYKLYCGRELADYSINFWNGFATVNIDLPDGASVGDHITFRSELTDNSRVEPFSHKFSVEVLEKVKKVKGTKGNRKPPVSDSSGNYSPFKGMVGMPNLIEIRKDQWNDYKFGKYDCLEIINNGELGFDFAINIDNQYLLTELLKTDNIEKMRYQYKYVVALIGMALLHNNQEQQAREITKALSPVLIPITNL